MGRTSECYNVTSISTYLFSRRLPIKCCKIRGSTRESWNVISKITYLCLLFFIIFTCVRLIECCVISVVRESYNVIYNVIESKSTYLCLLSFITFIFDHLLIVLDSLVLFALMSNIWNKYRNSGYEGISHTFCDLASLFAMTVLIPLRLSAFFVLLISNAASPEKVTGAKY
jgi:hypothetical protein